MQQTSGENFDGCCAVSSTVLVPYFRYEAMKALAWSSNFFRQANTSDTPSNSIRTLAQCVRSACSSWPMECFGASIERLDVAVPVEG